MKKYIKMEKTSMIRQRNPHVQPQKAESLQRHYSPTKTSTNGHIHDLLTFLKLLTILLSTTYRGVLTTIKGKEFVQYSSPMKNNTNTRNPDKFHFFHCNLRHDTKKYHALKNKIERLIVKGYL